MRGLEIKKTGGPVRQTHVIDTAMCMKCNTIVFEIITISIDKDQTALFLITQARPCNIQQYFTAAKMFIFR